MQQELMILGSITEDYKPLKPLSEIKKEIIDFLYQRIKSVRPIGNFV